MNKIEYARNKLHNIIETGDTEKILAISKELDKLIVKYIKLKLDTNNKFAS